VPSPTHVKPRGILAGVTAQGRLERFGCASGPEDWQKEVEEFVQRDLLGWAAAPGLVAEMSRTHPDYRWLVTN
jgi:hypothetical protein